MKKTSKIISIVFLSFSIFLLCYVYYSSKIFHDDAFASFYFKYYIIAFILVFLSFISFFIPEKLKINITIICISFLIGIYFVEGYLFIQNNLNAKQEKKNKFEIYKNNTGRDYDTRTRLQIYKDLKKEDPEVVVQIYPFIFVSDKNLNYFPLSGLPNHKTIQCNENGYYSIYKSDRYGFKTPDEEWDKDEIEFLLVGDSFANGSCVNEPDSISGNLRKLNNNETGVLNLSQGGSGPLIEYATLREYLPVKKIRRVLWIYSPRNDLWNLMGELENKILFNYLEDKNFSQNLVEKNQELERLLLNKLEQATLLGEKSKTYYIKRFLKLKDVRKISTESFFPAPLPIKEFKNILRLTSELTEKNNSKLYFVYLADHDINSDRENYEEVIKVLKSLDIPVIDIRETFQNHEDRLSLFPFRMDGHYNEKGYRLVAKTILDKIRELEQ